MNIFFKTAKTVQILHFSKPSLIKSQSKYVKCFRFNNPNQTLSNSFSFSTEKLTESDPKKPDFDQEIFIKKARRANTPSKISFTLKDTLKDIAEITKFRLSLANSTVALSAYLLLDPTLDSKILLFFISTQMIAMSSQTSNQDIEKEYDKLMIRTCNRPLPKNRIEPKYARLIASTLYISSNVIFYNFFPINALYMANFIFLSYTLVYTPLKRKSTINTTIGAISGSLPPYLGWLAAGGDFLSYMPIGITTYMFCWQFSHFYGILWIYQEDYKKAGFKMIEDPVLACKHMKLALMLKLVSGSLVFAGLSLNPLYISNLALVYGLWKYSYIPLKNFEKEPTIKNAKILKTKSYNHLMIFFGVIFANNIWLLGKKYFEKH